MLARAYELGKDEIIVVLEHLAGNLAFVLQDAAVFEQALALFRESAADFSHCLIVTEAQSAERMPVLSFDRKLSRLEDVTEVNTG